MTERLELIPPYYFAGHKGPEQKTVTVEYIKKAHWLTEPRRSGKHLTAYEVFVDGVKTGYIEQIEYTSSRNYAGSRIRYDMGTCLEWTWYRYSNKKRNSPGLYSKSRREAVADMLGYSYAKVVK